MPDASDVEARAAKTRAVLEAAQVELTRMRHGPGPDNQPPTIVETTRADGLWPFLLIRSYTGDDGARPIQRPDPASAHVDLGFSPDILVTHAGPAGEPTAVGRAGIAALQARAVGMLTPSQPHDIWVHVWNLGQMPATAIRVRVRLQPTDFWPSDWPDPQERYLGGSYLDLGDRVSETSHLVVKAATFTPDDVDSFYMVMLVATAECISDVASGVLALGADRHTAHRLMESSP